MEVETYEIEHPDTDPQIQAEAVELIEKLDLEGQRTLVKGEGEEEKRAIPYHKMDETGRVVFQSLFSQKTEVADYGEGIIPVRVLQMIAHGRELFDHVWVWHPKKTEVNAGVP